MKRHVHITLLLAAALAVGISLFIGHVHSVAVAASLAGDATAAATITPPDGSALLTLLMQGKYLPLVGGALMLLISALRAGSIKWVSPWFKTKLGGYVLGYGGTFAFYLGAAWYASAPVSGQLIAMAVAAAIMSAGALEHGSDLLGLVKATPAVAKGAAVAILVLLGAAATDQALAGCSATTQQTLKDDLRAGGLAELDCLQPALASTAAKIEPALEMWLRNKLAGGQPANGPDVSAAVKALPGDAWHCAWATAIAMLLAPSSSTGTGSQAITVAAATPTAPSAATAMLRSQLEDLRPILGGGHFKTTAGYW